MSEQTLLYVGPSWAHRSFDTPSGEETDYTNLYKELNLSVIDLSKCGASNIECLEFIRSYKEKISGIIWVYCEPLTDPVWSEKMLLELLENENFWQTREHISQKTFEQMNSLGIPIALIGGHSDVDTCVQPNITIIHPSWQKFLADYCNVDLKTGWGAEVAHRFVLVDAIESKPSKTVVQSISDTFRSWHQMEMYRVFNWCHPTRLGNQLFAQEIKSKLQSWADALTERPQI